MKKVFYAIIALIALYFVLALFGPKHVGVERSITINASPEVMREKLGDFRFFHEQWSPWTLRDPDMKTTFTGTPGQPGHKYAWEGNDDVGSGEMELVRYSGDSIVQVLRFAGQGDAMAYHIVKPAAGGSEVSWGLGFDVGFFWRTPMLFMNMDKMIGADYEQGLVRLKEVMEKGEEPM